MDEGERILKGMSVNKPRRKPPVLEDIKENYERKHGKPKLKSAQRPISQAYLQNYEGIRWG